MAPRDHRPVFIDDAENERRDAEIRRRDVEIERRDVEIERLINANDVLTRESERNAKRIAEDAKAMVELKALVSSTLKKANEDFAKAK